MFIPHTKDERDHMLQAIGVDRVEDLFADVPEEIRYPKLNLPDPLTEMEVVDQIRELSDANETTRDLVCFLGAGAYNHFVPAVVDSFLRNGAFYSAYTPYQAEISQGTLQAIFEYQSLITALTAMDASNASHYDGATSLAEAGLLAYHQFRGKRKKMVVSRAIHPHYKEVLLTYMDGFGDVEMIIAETNQMSDHIDAATAMVVVQYPDFLGRIESYQSIADQIHAQGGLFCVIVNPIALALLTPPGKFGADIVVGEGQPLGIPLSFGGPYLGFFATKEEYIRKISGRIVGKTEDIEGKPGYVLTLTAREQHIRRERATSNICSNQGLIALAAAIYMSALGKNGLQSVAQLNYHKAHYAAEKIAELDGYEKFFDHPFFNEFVISCPKPVAEVNEHLLEHNILGGLDISEYYPELKNPMLVAVTEMNSQSEIDYFCGILEEIAHD